MRTVEILEDIQEEAFASAWNNFNLYRYIWPELQDHIIWESEDKQIVAVYQNGESLGIPINCLRLSNLVLRKDFILEYTFEIKEIHTDAQKPAI